MPFDCFGYRLAMTRGSVHKIFIVMLSEAKHLFAIPNVLSFVKGDRGLNCEAAPYPPLTPNPCTLFKGMCSARIMS